MTTRDEPENGRHAAEGDEFELRMETLRAPAGHASAGGAAASPSPPFSPRRDRSQATRLALGATTLVVLVAVVAGAFALTRGGSSGALGSLSIPLPGSGPTATATPTPSPTPTPIPTRVAYPTPTLVQGTPTALGPAPSAASCTPPAPAPRTLPATFPGAIGASPLWVAGFDGPLATRHIKDPGPGNSRYGWEIGIIFAIEPSLTDPVVVRGERLDNREPLWFGYKTPSVAVVLDPQQPGLPDYDNYSMGLNEDWAAWESTLHIPAAGCYALEATWPGGSWRVTFAAGR
ncbi:MAG TPA: hypothetical protein VFW76_08460 [Ktedonobacterales bacterium]|nr:hypothetical protein [Ktedonobacterales bacterium]